MVGDRVRGRRWCGMVEERTVPTSFDRTNAGLMASTAGVPALRPILPGEPLPGEDELIGRPRGPRTEPPIRGLSVTASARAIVVVCLASIARRSENALLGALPGAAVASTLSRHDAELRAIRANRASS